MVDYSGQLAVNLLHKNVFIRNVWDASLRNVTFIPVIGLFNYFLK